MYCFIIAFLVSVRIATISSSVSASSELTTGKRPMNSGNHSERQQIFRLHVSHRFPRQRRLHFQSRTAKAHHFLADAFLDDFVEADKRATADEQNLLGINLDVFLVRMLAPALRRNVAGAAFENFQQRLLHAFAADVARDAETLSVLRPILSISSM